MPYFFKPPKRFSKKMKNLLLTLILYLLCGITNGQTSVTYTKVIQTIDTNRTKDILYLNAKEWFVETFKSSNDVIQLDDKENGMIQGKAKIKYSYTTNYNGYINFTIKIWLKNGRYKYEFSNFIHEAKADNCFSLGLITDGIEVNKPCEHYGYINTLGKAWTDVKNVIGSDVQEISKSLNDKMNQKIDSDW
jgi:hypothetical protein